MIPLIGVMGEFSRGKSALINALAGESILPVHALPMTAEATPITIRVGEKSITLLDTPGIGALNPEHREQALSVIDQLDVLMFVFAVDPPLSLEECDFLHEVLPRVPRVLLIQNKADLLDESERAEVTAYNRGVIDSAFAVLRSVPILSVSAVTGEGLGALCEALSGLDADQLRRERWRLRVGELRERLRDAYAPILARTQQRAILNAELLRLQETFLADEAQWRASLAEIVAGLHLYVLGNLSAVIYKADLSEFEGKRGINLALDELRHVRDGIIHEVERVQSRSRARMVEALRRLDVSTDGLPTVKLLQLPKPTLSVIPVRVKTRDRAQAISAYRMIVRRMAEHYGGQITPIIEAQLESYRAGIAAQLTDDQRVNRSIEGSRISHDFNRF